MVEDEIIHSPYNIDWNGVVHPALPLGATQIGWPQTVWRARNILGFIAEYRVLCPVCRWRRSIWGRPELCTLAAASGAIWHHQCVVHGVNNGVADKHG